MTLHTSTVCATPSTKPNKTKAQFRVLLDHPARKQVSSRGPHKALVAAVLSCCYTVHDWTDLNQNDRGYIIMTANDGR